VECDQGSADSLVVGEQELGDVFVGDVHILILPQLETQYTGKSVILFQF
jgi:hypothetical protein